MNAVIRIGGNDVSSYVISYERSSSLCSSIGTLLLVMSPTYSGSLSVWDIITIEEDGEEVAKYYISSFRWDDPAYNLIIEAQDGSKRLTDYFIPETYTVSTASTTKYWIQKFLEDVGLSFSFTDTGYGSLVSNNTVLGLTNAYDQIMTLLQMSGWYLTFDTDNTAIIGKLNKDISNIVDEFDDTTILEIVTEKNDSVLRNRAVVWGGANNGSSVCAEAMTLTPWNYDENDYRTVIVSNSNIPNFGTAKALANKIVNEYDEILYTKTLTIAGTTPANVGDFVFVNSNIFTGNGLVTTKTVSMSKDGLVTVLVLDEKCSRIFAYFNFKDYVYIGTTTAGVWRKPIDTNEPQIWENYSTGLENLFVTDLNKNLGVLSCVTSDGSLYRRYENSPSWIKIPINSLPATVSGVEENIEGIKVRAAAQHGKDNIIYALADNVDTPNDCEYNVPISGLQAFMNNYDESHCWVVGINPYTGLITGSKEITVSGYDGHMGVDIEHDGKNIYASVVAGKEFEQEYPQRQPGAGFQAQALIRFDDVYAPALIPWYINISVYSLGDYGFKVLNSDDPNRIRRSYGQGMVWKGNQADYPLPGYYWSVYRYLNIETYGIGPETAYFQIEFTLHCDMMGEGPHLGVALDCVDEFEPTISSNNYYLEPWWQHGMFFGVDHEEDYSYSNWQRSYVGSGPYQTLSGISLPYCVVKLPQEFTELNTIISGFDGPKRLDASRYNPVVSIFKGANLARFIDTASEEITTVTDFDFRPIFDFKYADIDTSGTILRTLVYSRTNAIGTESYLEYLDITDTSDLSFSDGVIRVYSSDIGDNIRIERVETSNHKLPNQFQFFSTMNESGISSFYQDEPEGLGFSEYNTNLPETRITCIRLDDRI